MSDKEFSVNPLFVGPTPSNPEVAALRAELAEAKATVDAYATQIDDGRRQIGAVVDENARLAAALREAREHVAALLRYDFSDRETSASLKAKRKAEKWLDAQPAEEKKP